MLSSPDWKLTLLTNHQVSRQCPTTKYPCSAQPQTLQCPTAKYPCSAQLQSIPAVPNRRVSRECPTAEYQYSCSAFAVLQGRQLREGRETLHFLCNSGSRVGMLEVDNFTYFQGSGRVQDFYISRRMDGMRLGVLAFSAPKVALDPALHPGGLQGSTRQQ